MAKVRKSDCNECCAENINKMKLIINKAAKI
jgi:hypothetical protein